MHKYYKWPTFDSNLNKTVLIFKSLHITHHNKHHKYGLILSCQILVTVPYLKKTDPKWPIFKFWPQALYHYYFYWN